MNGTSTSLLAALLFLVPAQESSFLSKMAVEQPIERALSPSPAPGPSARRVAPGLVRWHADLASACAAAQRSGKPVLLFQLLGRLDEEFC